MRWDDFRRSDNVDDVRGEGGGGGFRFPGGGGGLGIGGLIVVGLVSWALGVDPRLILAGIDAVQGGGGGGYEQQDRPQGQRRELSQAEQRQGEFVRAVLAQTEDVWTEIFREQGKRYEAPRLTLFSGQTRSACGRAVSAMGPFYCPGDRRVYLDTEFFDELTQKFRAPGDFARAYVIAHEIGHHVQNLIGVMDSAQGARERARSEEESNAISVRIELQADCLAGVWAARADAKFNILEQGDVEGALKAASEIGDDKLQRRSGGEVVPDSFTHGSSAQRTQWFKTGLQSGDMRRCDTFKARL
ncbi:KPN_02809 family neutral zinc metallopeptidase [Chenggangzhangella methanolivorans]|uniref:Neutral zinc metallopeptidase n=1 Tax=Chenggangzhangella methanolivorans TaxID=1437009 RepID=A0A9E6R6M0_9HYPH|nr:neutral zinc metallopeptidase [Chenggangzhangella methanolivorans]QZN99215.1 neutral zinc metallopeptidase [Chenggangzhangella methanolivorans]